MRRWDGGCTPSAGVREELGLCNYKPENLNLPQNHLPEQGRSSWLGRELGRVSRMLENIIPALLGDAWRVQLTSHQHRSRRWKRHQHQLRFEINLGFFLGLSPVLKSFYNRHRLRDSAAAAWPERNSSSFLGGKEIVCDRVVLWLWEGAAERGQDFTSSFSHLRLATSTGRKKKNRSAELTLLRRTCPRGQEAPAEGLAQLSQAWLPPRLPLPKGTSLNFQLQLSPSLCSPSGLPHRPNIYAA